MGKIERILLYAWLGIMALLVGLAWGWFYHPDISVSLILIFGGFLGAVLVYPFTFKRRGP